MSKDFSSLLGGALSNKKAAEIHIRDRIVIREDFRALIPPLSKDEIEQLETNILKEGVRDPLVVWPVEDSFILVDGHNRFSVCLKHSLDFPFKEIHFGDEEEVRDWMIKNQLGRRNLSPEQQSYLRGLRYNREKSQGRRTDLTLDQNDLKSQESTATNLAKEYNVSEATIKRDGEFAAGLEMISKDNPDLKSEILNGKSKLSKQEVRSFSKPEKNAKSKMSIDAKRTIGSKEVARIAFNYVSTETRSIKEVFDLIGFSEAESSLTFFIKWNDYINNLNK